MISPTLQCQKLISQRKKKGLEVHNFGLGSNPLKCDWTKIGTEHTELVSKDFKPYGSLNGLSSLQELLKKRYSRSDDTNIILGHGLKELIFVVQMAARGKIIHITPSWVSYHEQVVCLGKKDSLIELATSHSDGYRINPKTLRETLEKETAKGVTEIVLLFNNPNNPTGICYSPDEVEALSRVISDFPNVIVLADDIYSELVFDDSFEYQSLSNFLPDQTIVGNSFSKNIGSGGYRCGWLFFPPALQDFYQRCSFIASGLYSCLSMPIQYWAVDVLTKGGELVEEGDGVVGEDGEDRVRVDQWTSFLTYSKKIFKSHRDLAVEKLGSTKIQFVIPNSSWYFFLNFDHYRETLKERYNITTSAGISEWLVDQAGIVCVAGSAFRNSELTARFSLVDFTLSDVANDTTLEVLSTQMDLLVNFVNQKLN